MGEEVFSNVSVMNFLDLGIFTFLFHLEFTVEATGRSSGTPGMHGPTKPRG